MMFGIVKTVMDDDDEEEATTTKEFPMANVSTETLKKAIAFCEHYKEEQMTPIQKPIMGDTLDDLVQPWYAEYINVEDGVLFELTKAANYMNIEPLLALTTAALALLIKRKSVRSCVCVYHVCGMCFVGCG
jgi:S-phase kinase-associated protein 1